MDIYNLILNSVSDRRESINAGESGYLDADDYQKALYGGEY